MDEYLYDQQDDKKAEELKERLLIFAETDSFEDAKKLAKEILPTVAGVTSFYAGIARCTVVNRTNLLRITFDSPKEFICYDFFANSQQESNYAN